MLMAAHVWLAQGFLGVKHSGAFFTGCIAPDVRYMDSSISRETTHSWEYAKSLIGDFGVGYRHHLAVDRAFYRRVERQPLLGRIGAMNLSVIAELHALRRFSQPTAMEVPDPTVLAELGVRSEALESFVDLSTKYLELRDPALAIGLLGGSLRQRAQRYLDHWQKYGSALKVLAIVAAPLLESLFASIKHEAESYLSTEVE